VVGMWVWGAGSEIRKPKKYGSGGLKSGPKIVFSGTPGRGVLRFLAEAYRRPVHFSAKNAVFSKNLQI